MLAGWVGPADRWERFETEWSAILEMKPRVEYFKYSEAIGFHGQFNGISAPSRTEKLKLLINLISEFGLVGISASIPHRVFQGWFRYAPPPFNNSYLVMFYGVISRLLRYVNSIGYEGKVELVFDTQSDQVAKVQAIWDEFVSAAPREFVPLLGDPPLFRDDKRTIALQAADMHAGWLREMNTAVELGKPIPEPLWHPAGEHIRREYNFMEWWHAAETFVRLFGANPITYSFGEGTELSVPPRLHLPAWPLRNLSARQG